MTSQTCNPIPSWNVKSSLVSAGMFSELCSQVAAVAVVTEGWGSGYPDERSPLSLSNITVLNWELSHFIPGHIY